MPFRPEDAALVARLEDEALYARLLRDQAGPGAGAPPSRASGLLHELRALPGAEAAFALASGPAGDPPGRPDALAALMTAESFVGYPPALLHHLALHFARVAACRERELLAAATSGVALGEGANPITAWELALSACLGLAEERAYVRGFVARALGPPSNARGQEQAAGQAAGQATRAADVARLAEALPFALLDRLGARALRGARGLESGARVALSALARVEAAARRAGAGEALRALAIERAGAAHARAIDEALAPIGQALDDATLANEVTTRGIEVLQGVVAVWEFSGQDEAVERFFVERAEPVCWEIQRRKEWDRFALLLGQDPAAPGLPSRGATFRLVESLIARVTADRGRVAYAAACAQFLVFYTNVVQTLERQIAVAERAVAVCPTHRNGRAVLASFLCQKARRNVEATLVSSAGLAEADALVERARALFPPAREVEETAALVRARRASGLGRLP